MVFEGDTLTPPVALPASPLPGLLFQALWGVRGCVTQLFLFVLAKELVCLFTC